MRPSVREAVVALAAALLSGCAASPSTGGGGATSGTTVWYPEIFIVNDYSRYQELGPLTEADTGDHVNLVNSYFARSTNLVANGVQVILVGQETWKTQEANISYAVDRNGCVDLVDAIDTFARYREDRIRTSAWAANDMAILLTSRCSQDGSTEIAYLGAMCSPASGVAIVRTPYTLAFDAGSIARAIGRAMGMCADPPAARPSVCPTLPPSLGDSLTCFHHIMSTSSPPDDAPTSFSKCSQVDLDDWIANRMPQPSCLTLHSVR